MIVFTIIGMVFVGLCVLAGIGYFLLNAYAKYLGMPD